MNKTEALHRISAIVENVSGHKKEISLDTDLRGDNILDSLDMLIFFMEFEKSTGVVVPETEVLVAENWYSVKKLCEKLGAKSGCAE